MSSCCGNNGPGYASPKDAMLNGPREKILYTTCTRIDPTKPDVLSTVDVDPQSRTYSQVIHQLPMQHVGDEIHHSGWNACSSCFGDRSVARSHLVLPSLHSSRVYIIDVKTDSRQPTIHTVIEPAELMKYNVTFPHTSHCLADGNIMLSTLGDNEGNAQGAFLLIDAKTFTVKSLWGSQKVAFNYDYWYQPHFNVMISTSWGAPRKIKTGFNLADVQTGQYGHQLYVWNWREQTLRQTIDLDPVAGSMPLEIRFKHDPMSIHGFVGAALGSTVFHFYQQTDGIFACDSVITIPSKSVTGWILPTMPSLITDIIISMDDRFLYFSNWLHGDIRQYDITDPYHPKMVGQLFIAGLLTTDSGITVTDDPEHAGQHPPTVVKGVRVEGGPQMLQLSLDGQRLYVTTSLYSVWDKQFYPKMQHAGSQMLRVDVDTVKGGLTLNQDFIVNFATVPDGPMLAHEMRYPGGDCSSDIWLVPTSNM